MMFVSLVPNNILYIFVYSNKTNTMLKVSGVKKIKRFNEQMPKILIFNLNLSSTHGDPTEDRVKCHSVIL